MFTSHNLRFLLELSRTGRISDTSKRLGVDQTTVSRRISRLEK
ncbi:LysR family transcriptional regulator, partial [Bacillus amyloliquefaciens]|nr:LysR family transcriptional regulator [Bacillus amyloliquefaciens]